MRKLLVVTLTAAVIGCGARSELLSTDGPTTSSANGGSGGSGGVGGDDPIGGGGSGGMPIDCAVDLVVDGPIAIAGGAMAHQRQPDLVAIDDSQVVMALEWTDASFPNAPQEVRHNAFFPWDSFPTSDVGPTFLADFDRGFSFRATTSGDDGFAILMKADAGPVDAMVFAPFLEPGMGDIGNTFALGGADVIALASHDGNGRFLLGWRGGVGMGTALFVGVQEADPAGQLLNTVAAPQVIGCSVGPVTADASWNGDRWVVVASTGSDTCLTGPPPPGPPDIVQAMFIDTNGNITFTGNIVSTNVVDRLKVVEVDGGHYAFWTGPGDGFGGPLTARRMDEDGDPEGEAFTLPGLDDAVVGGLWNVGRFGSGFLVAWQSGADGTMHARRYDEDANPLGQVTLPSSAVSPPDILGDPSGGTAAVLAYPVGTGPSDQMEIRRLRCPEP